MILLIPISPYIHCTYERVQPSLLELKPDVSPDLSLVVVTESFCLVITHCSIQDTIENTEVNVRLGLCRYKHSCLQHRKNSQNRDSYASSGKQGVKGQKDP